MQIRNDDSDADGRGDDDDDNDDEAHEVTNTNRLRNPNLLHPATWFGKSETSWVVPSCSRNDDCRPPGVSLTDDS